LNFARSIAKPVLVVDDDYIVRENLKLLLTTAGHGVLTAETGEAALESMQRTFTPILIVDVQLPGLDGLAICRAIRQHTYSSYVYIMLHSSKDTDKDIFAGLSAGADDYLSKRRTNSELVGRLQTAQHILALKNFAPNSAMDSEIRQPQSCR
jgi:DNA-binding response OmpR family regulator